MRKEGGKTKIKEMEEKSESDFKSLESYLELVDLWICVLQKRKELGKSLEELKEGTTSTWEHAKPFPSSPSFQTNQQPKIGS